MKLFGGEGGYDGIPSPPFNFAYDSRLYWCSNHKNTFSVIDKILNSILCLFIEFCSGSRFHGRNYFIIKLI